VVPRTLVRKVDDTTGKLAKEQIADLATKKEFVGVTIEQKSKPRVQPRPAKESEVRESLVEVKRGEHG
jgi:hypothetical protein